MLSFFLSSKERQFLGGNKYRETSRSKRLSELYCEHISRENWSEEMRSGYVRVTRTTTCPSNAEHTSEGKLKNVLFIQASQTFST